MIVSRLSELETLIGQEITDSPSAAGNWLKPRLEKIVEGHIEMSVMIRSEMCNPFGNIHGGMMALVADEAIGWAIISLGLSQHYTSISLTLDFLYAAAAGERIRAAARIVRHGKKIINAEVLIKNEQGVLLAKATSNLVVTGMKIAG